MSEEKKERKQKTKSRGNGDGTIFKVRRDFWRGQVKEVFNIRFGDIYNFLLCNIILVDSV